MIEERPAARLHAACKEILRLQNAVFDGEATAAQREKVRRHQESCPDCRQVEDAARCLREHLVQAAWPRIDDDARDDSLLAALRDEGICHAPEDPDDSTDPRCGRMRDLASVFAAVPNGDEATADERSYTQMMKETISSICVHLRPSVVPPPHSTLGANGGRVARSAGSLPPFLALRRVPSLSIRGFAAPLAPALATMAVSFLLMWGAMRWAEGPGKSMDSDRRARAPHSSGAAAAPAMTLEEESLEQWMAAGSPALASLRRIPPPAEAGSRPRRDPRRGAVPHARARLG